MPCADTLFTFFMPSHCRAKGIIEENSFPYLFLRAYAHTRMRNRLDIKTL